MHGIGVGEPSGVRLVREKWHKPLVSVVVTYRNYSAYVEGALRSLLDQTHKNWECVVVDDASDSPHRERLTSIVGELNDSRIKIHQLSENVGQVPSFFAGVEQTTGNFICLLDPDDRYAETFLEEALGAHLNVGVMCPIVSTEQFLMTERGVIGSGLRGDLYTAGMRPYGKYLEARKPEKPRILFVWASIPGWHWTSSSAMMFRRAALKYLKPNRKLVYKGCADGYLAQGAHALGGTLFLQKPLVYRMLHASNAWIDADIYASGQDMQRKGAHRWSEQAFTDAIEAIRHNGLPEFRRDPPKEPAPPPKKIEVPQQRGMRRHLERWRKSIRKRVA
ncbi:glycosyltransferase family 2 protein [Hyphomicrobium facile]|uniref:Glycosyl transferase family 2 n=1 Tax=Hyphomicrobium facile TaxID=51670 RepID=A0A1I7MYS9_9HYPH|nr:glycosyltransferase [Hyphomicrobium facile]SFV27552.1 Glycosyl transferase family 2 [Hyphomicrobium facile]